MTERSILYNGSITQRFFFTLWRSLATSFNFAADQVRSAFDFTVDKFPLSALMVCVPRGMRCSGLIPARSWARVRSLTDTRLTRRGCDRSLTLAKAYSMRLHKSRRISAMVTMFPSHRLTIIVAQSTDRGITFSLVLSSVAVMIAVRSTSLWAFIAMLARISPCFAA